VDTGSREEREENASKQKRRASVLIQSEPKRALAGEITAGISDAAIAQGLRENASNQESRARS
jgi:hypothetical protein